MTVSGALIAGASVHADVYKSVNEKGEVIYSDQPTPMQNPELPELPTYKTRGSWLTSTPQPRQWRALQEREDNRARKRCHHTG
jgi:hypothetical protein